MKKLLLLASVALLGVAAYAVPSVDPTADMATVVFSVPEAECTTTMNFVGDVQGYDPTADELPVAELVEGQWYKIVLPLNGGATQGKICPRSLTGAGTWNYQGKTYTIDEASSSIEWASIVDDYGTQNKIVLSDGCAGQVVYINVVEWQANFCDMPNPAGEASFTVTFEVPETVDKHDIALTIEGQGEGFSWAQLGEIAYDEDFDSFSGTAEVPAGCSYKYLISYKGQANIYMSGDNLNMPYGLVANDEVLEWDSDPFIDPTPGGSGTFTITFTGDCVPTADQKVFIAGNFEDTPSWERVYEMDKTGEATWTATDLTYPSGFMFKFVIQYLDEQGEISQELWNPDDNITFDEVTFDYELEAKCPEVAADEAEADAEAASYKVVEDGVIIIVTPAGKFNLLGAPIK